ncbi:13761_t:CDS:2 [Entrophospora sp. SA101]|nr:13761_t:CDS:2 [Entrophospora sp. SA101]CAJ0924089.1 12747_t:CDS:2 [Entrophospora sp. SA101]
MLKLTTFDDTNEITIMKIAHYNNHVKNKKMKNNYSKNPNEVIGQSQQPTSNPTMTIPQMEWINIDSKYPSTNTVVPPGLKNFAFGYHSDSKNLIIYGQTYMLDLNTMLWKNPLTTDPTKIAPDPRTRMLFGIDKWSSYRDQLVIFGGKGNGDIMYNDIWSFNVPYATWTQISNISPSASFIPQMYDTLGGIDSTLAVFNNPNNTMWITHGTNGSNFFTDAWAIGLGGSWAPGNNGLTANIVKVDMSSSSVIPTGRREAGGAILPNNRIVTYGGCNNTSSAECAIPETFSLQLNSDGVNPPAYNAKPFWAEQNRCLGSREEAAMVMVGKKPQDNLAVVFGGKAANGTGIGGDGEVGILDANLGTWVRVLPKADPVYNVPKARAGARMLSAQTAIFGSATDVVDILMYGGEALDGSSKYYNDLWILRLYTGSLISQSSSNSTTPVKFLDCIIEGVTTTSAYPPFPSSSGTNEVPTGRNPSSSNPTSSDDSFANAIVPISHLLFSTIA